MRWRDFSGFLMPPMALVACLSLAAFRDGGGGPLRKVCLMTGVLNFACLSHFVLGLVGCNPGSGTSGPEVCDELGPRSGTHEPMGAAAGGARSGTWLPREVLSRTVAKCEVTRALAMHEQSLGGVG